MARLLRAGLDEGITNIHLATYLASVCASICLFVFVNASLPSLLIYVVNASPDQTGAITGTLILADESLSLLLVPIWGYTADLVSARFVTAAGHLIAACALVLMTLARRPFPDLLLIRVVYTLAVSALSCSIAGTLAAMTRVQGRPKATDDEERPLLPSTPKSESVSRLSSVVGFVSGLGALVAVFVFLRLPPILAARTSAVSEFRALAIGTQQAYYILAACEVAMSFGVFLGLDIPRATKQPRSLSIQNQIASLFRGFEIARHDAELALCYFAGLAARSQTVAVSAFIPLYITQYYIRTGRCKLDDMVNVKTECHEAYVLSSILTGSIQLTSLIAAIPIGLLTSRSSAPKATYKWIAAAFVLGTSGFATFCLLPAGNPNNLIVDALAVLLIGTSQISGVVLTLTLLANARSRLVSSEEIAGSLAAAYSVCGSIGILFVSQVAGPLSDQLPTSAFFLTALLNLSVVIAATALSSRRDTAPSN